MPESIDWDAPCCAVPVEWHVQIETGRVIVDSEPHGREDALPFEIKPVPRSGAIDLMGERYVVAVDGGYVVGFNAGEFGGGVWWFSTDGTRRRKLTLRASESLEDHVSENVHGLALLGQDLLAFQGLTHLGSNSGRVVRIRRAPNGEWQPSLFAELRACPHAVVQESTSSWFFAATTGVWRIDARARVRPIWRPPGGHLYYPNSIALDSTGVIYMRMRDYIVKLTPRSNGGYAARVLVPPSP
jgi:hypothetical protein